MNGFEKHGIGHTSPSQINMWCDCPAAWGARYLFDKKFPFGVAAQVGVRTENVVSKVLMGKSFGDALQEEQNLFRRQNALNTNEKEINRVNDIEYMSLLALDELKPYGEPEFINTLTGHKQQSIEIKCNGADWVLPVMGYLDFVFPKYGLVVDLKTTLRMPSNLSLNHARQGAVYKKAMGNKQMKFLYVTPKKTGWLELEDEKPYLEQIKAVLNRKEKLLRHFAKEDLKNLLPVNMSSFYWNGSENIRKELYGL